MKVQQLYQKIHNSVCRQELVFIRALQGHSGKSLDISMFSHRKIEKWIRTISVSYAILQTRIFSKIRRTRTRRFWNKQRQENNVLLTLVAIGSTIRPEAQALPPHEEPS